MNVLESLPQPVIFAHRGASAYAPENTLSAFSLAFEQGAPAVEFDIKLTADRQVILLHDFTVDRTTNGTGPVKDFTFDALRELDAGSWKGEKYRGEKIPSLEDVFAAFGAKLFMNIELTNYATPDDGLAEEVCKIVEKHGMQNRVLFSSFDYNNLKIARGLLPDVPCGQLTRPLYFKFWQQFTLGKLNVDAEHPFLLDVCRYNVARVHKRGRRVHVWTVNREKDMLKLKKLGVDGIITDYPDVAKKAFGQ